MNKLPSNWEIVSMSDVCTVLGGGTPKTSINEYWNGDIIWLSPTDLPEIGSISKISSSNKKITQLGLNKSSAKLLPKGSVVFSSRASIGKIGIAEVELTTNQGFTNFICGEKISNNYLCYVLKRNIGKIASLSNSTTFAEVSKTSIKSFQIPLPPLSEQKRIVSKLDALFERIDKSIALLEENIKQTEHLMASALDEVFTSNSDKWKLSKFSDFASLRHGHQFRKYDFVEKGIPVVKIGQCKKDGSLDLSNCNFIANERLHEFEEDQIYKDDLLMALTGGTLGKVTWVDEDYGSLVQNYRVGNFFSIKGKSIKRFLMYVLMSDIFQNLVADKVNQGAQPNIGKEHIDNMLVPLPSISEQIQLVEKFDVILKNQTLILKQQTDKLNNLKYLKESFLDKAFKGEL